MTDVNQGRTLGGALERCQALDDLGLYWFEEPIAYDKFSGYARLSRALKTPVMLGENFYGPETLARAIMERAGDYMMPDLARIGGVTGGCVQRRWPAFMVSRYPRICTRKFPHTYRALPKPRIGWK